MKTTFTIQQNSPLSYSITDEKLNIIERNLALNELIAWCLTMAPLGYGINSRDGWVYHIIHKPETLGGPSDVPTSVPIK